MTEHEVEKLPRWAQELVASLSGKVTLLEHDNTLLHERLRDKVAAEGPSDTMLIHDEEFFRGEENPPVPLGDGTVIRFGDQLEASWDAEDQCLVISADTDVTITVGDRHCIMVRSAGGGEGT